MTVATAGFTLLKSTRRPAAGAGSASCTVTGPVSPAITMTDSGSVTPTSDFADSVSTGVVGSSPDDEDQAFRNFIVAFEGLNGRESIISNAEMQQFADFALDIILPPNPVRALDNSLNTAQARATELTRELNAARVARDRARELWEDTPFLERDLKVRRRNAWLDAVARFGAAAAAQAGQAVFVNAARRILDALPPPDRSIVVMTARAAADFVRNQLVNAERNLETLKTQHEAFVAAINQGGILLDINLAELRADFEGLKSGGSLEWRMAGTFVNKPFELRASVDFSEPVAAAGELLSQLIHR